MDAVIGMGGTWRDSDHTEVGLIIVGRDGVAVDAVASHIVGFDPIKIPTLRVAAERGLGEIDWSKIEILGEDIDNLSCEIPLSFATRLINIINRVAIFKEAGILFGG